MPGAAGVLWESVPNFSEGRDGATIAALAGEQALDVHSDPRHHRCVISLADCDGRRLLTGLVQRVEVAVERIDLRRHCGVHPRLGAADVLPIVPLGTGTLQDAEQLAVELAHRIWRRCQVPVYFYGSLAGGRSLSQLRRAGGTVRFDIGDRPHPTAGICSVGARPPLVALNLPYALPRAELSAFLPAMRSLPGVQALTFPAGAGRVQLSMNLTRLDRAGVAQVVAEAERLTGLTSAPELVGLCPATAAGPGCDGGLLEGRLAAAGAHAVAERWRRLAEHAGSRAEELRRLADRAAEREGPLAATRAQPESMLASAEEAVALLRLMSSVPGTSTDPRAEALLTVAAQGLRAGGPAAA